MEFLKPQFPGLESFGKVMEIYFTILCIIELCLIRSWISVRDCAYIPADFDFKIREITAKHLFNIACRLDE